MFRYSPLLILLLLTNTLLFSQCPRSIDVPFNGKKFEITVKVYDKNLKYLYDIDCYINNNGQINNSKIDCDLTGLDPNSHFFAYYLCNGNSGNCYNCMYSGLGENIGFLSVDILDFNIDKSSAGNLITWKTQNERNIDFYLLRRLDNDQWVEVAREEASNDEKTNVYSIIDASFNLNKTNYYQLSEVDFSGQIKPIQTITVDNRSNKNLNIVGVYDLFGNVVDENYKGMVIVKYEDGSSIKTFQ